MKTFKKFGITSVIPFLLASFVSTVSAAPTPVIHADIEVVEKVGRSASEYFYSPIIGFNYQDITSIDPSFFEEVNRLSHDFNTDNNIPVDRTELGGVIGLLVDGQYQIVSTSYWRAGFQTGLVYTSPVDSEFTLAKNNCQRAQLCTKSGTLETSAVYIPMLFTFSSYAKADAYIVTAKIGPTITHQMYDLDFGDYDLVTSNENQIFLQVGIDGRYRLGKSDNFLMTGFMGNLNVFGGGNGNFSGVSSMGSIGMYVGLSFS